MNRRSKPVAQKELEEQIGRALCSRAESIQVTSADTERMRRSVHRKIEEESGMKKWNMKRVFVVAAAICVLGTITAVAAGKVAYTSAGGSHLDDFTYDKVRGKLFSALQKGRKPGYIRYSPGHKPV